MDAVGYVYDKTDNSPLPGVNIVVRNASDQILMGTTTDALGFFNLPDVPAGQAVEFRFIGYRTQVPVLRDFNDGLNRIYMERASYGQPEVVVVGTVNRPTIKLNGLDALAISIFVLVIGWITYMHLSK